MRRSVGFLLCAMLALLLLVCGWLVPAHLRALDESVAEQAARKGPGLLDQGLALVSERQLGPAQMLLLAAQEERLPGRDKLALALTNAARQNPISALWGSAETPPEPLASAKSTRTAPFTEVLVRLENRGKVIELLQASRRPAVQELLHCRTLTNTVLFPPSSSAAGQAFDAAISLTGLLLDGGHLPTRLRDGVSSLAAEANRGGNPQRLEQVLLDLMSLGQRLNWGQLLAFVGQIQDVETLRLLATPVRKAQEHLPILFSAVLLSGKASDVAAYMMNFSETGMHDLGATLRYGTGGVNELVKRNQRLYRSEFRREMAARVPFDTFFRMAAEFCWLTPLFALLMKWFFYLGAGFFFAMAMHYAVLKKDGIYSMAPVSAIPRAVRGGRGSSLEPVKAGGFHVAREILFALGFLLVVLLLSEPFLAQESQKVESPFRLRLPTVGSLVQSGSTGVKPSIMNQLSLLTLLLFFVLQGLIYTACLIKLAEIRRQNLPARLKLRLLENEEHLFDAGLYLGFAGTIISLILVSMNVIKPSLMAAYGSTSFGIIFVSIFKIFHLRPARRKLLLEVESAGREAAAPAAARTFAPTA